MARTDVSERSNEVMAVCSNALKLMIVNEVGNDADVRLKHRQKAF